MAKIAGYSFNNKELLYTALTHRSAYGDNNERLEYLGDAILGVVIAEKLYQTFPLAAEGELTLLRSNLVKRETLAEIARSISLGKYIRLGPGESKNGGCERDSILADGLEAIFGSIYLDGGFEQCKNFILNIYQSNLENMNLECTTKDPKTQLQEYLQGKNLLLPEYVVINIPSTRQKKEFVVECRVKNIAPVIGHGKNKRSAEQDAAKKALGILERI